MVLVFVRLCVPRICALLRTLSHFFAFYASLLEILRFFARFCWFGASWRIMPCPLARNDRERAARLIWQLVYGRVNALDAGASQPERRVLAACFGAWRARQRRWDLIALVAHALVSPRYTRRLVQWIIFWWFERRRIIGLPDQ